MATVTNELWSSGSVRGPALRGWFTSIRSSKYAASGAAPTLPQFTPLYFDEATSTWKIWTSDNEEQTLTFDATGGTYNLFFEASDSGALTYLNTTGDTAVILAALEAMPSIQVGDVSVTRGTPVGNVTIFTVTFKGNWASKNVPAIAVTEALTGGGGTLVQATTVAGGGSPDIDGFVSEPENGANPTLLHATGETIHNVGMGGTIAYADIPLPAGESQPLLDIALSGLRAKGFNITGLATFH